MAWTSYVFKAAYDILKSLISNALEKKIRKITEAQVREELLLYLERNQSTPVNINIATINIILQEIYSIADATRDVEVSDSVIVVQSRPRLRIPSIRKESKINKKVTSITQQIHELMREESEKESDYDSDEVFTPFGKEISTLSTEREVFSEIEQDSRQPLIFSELESRGDKQIDNVSEHKKDNLNELIQQYRTRINNIISEENEDD